jgi:hypothetical protein
MAELPKAFGDVFGQLGLLIIRRKKGGNASWRLKIKEMSASIATPYMES